ncbi:MAG TPA: hypothetical protein VFE27_23635, partial [Acidobacteriaceae bacterium]|nr:hypothetical protein [Acidobacteriaceae bacterium]
GKQKKYVAGGEQRSSFHSRIHSRKSIKLGFSIMSSSAIGCRHPRSQKAGPGAAFDFTLRLFARSGK